MDWLGQDRFSPDVSEGLFIYFPFNLFSSCLSKIARMKLMKHGHTSELSRCLSAVCLRPHLAGVYLSICLPEESNNTTVSDVDELPNCSARGDQARFNHAQCTKCVSLGLARRKAVIKADMFYIRLSVLIWKHLK